MTRTDGDMQEDAVAVIDALRRTAAAIRGEIGKAVEGQREVVDLLLVCLFAGGHGLLVGVPGLAKTLMVRSLAKSMALRFSRIQFTPDLMPSDITGTDILQEDDLGRRRFEFVRGPIFANIVLADEINRTPPKTQAALLESMQEHHVTCTGHTYPLDPPFFVLATQNPIEQEGTYPLPEAQLDRFMFFITVDYPDEKEELAVARATTGARGAEPTVVCTAADLVRFQAAVRLVPVPDHLYAYAVRLVRASRPGAEAPPWVNEAVSWGAGPRAVQCLILGAKAHAALHGAYAVRLEDIRAVVPSVLGHRILLNFHAESTGLTGAKAALRLLAEVPTDQSVSV